MAVNSVAILRQSPILDSHALPNAPIEQSVLGIGPLTTQPVPAQAVGVIGAATWHSSLAITFAARNRSVASAVVAAFDAWLLAATVDSHVVCLTLSTTLAVIDAPTLD